MTKTRRNLLIGGAAGALGAALVAQRVLSPACLAPAKTALGDDRILRILRPLVGDLIGDQDLATFARIYAQRFPGLVNNCGIAEHAVTHCLLSTNFFDDARDPDAQARFTEFYDPYRNPCSNPLARFDAEV
ncbi:MAG: hypothetical protein AAF415_01515 [Pseudomonadota bacterium]